MKSRSWTTAAASASGAAIGVRLSSVVVGFMMASMVLLLRAPPYHECNRKRNKRNTIDVGSGGHFLECLVDNGAPDAAVVRRPAPSPRAPAAARRGHRAREG